MSSDFIEIIAQLQDLHEDPDTTKALKGKIDLALTALNSNSELALDKTLLILEEMNSLDLSSYHRTRVWDIVSLLESVKSQL